MTYVPKIGTKYYKDPLLEHLPPRFNKIYKNLNLEEVYTPINFQTIREMAKLQKNKPFEETVDSYENDSKKCEQRTKALHEIHSLLGNAFETVGNNKYDLEGELKKLKDHLERMKMVQKEQKENDKPVLPEPEEDYYDSAVDSLNDNEQDPDESFYRFRDEQPEDELMSNDILQHDNENENGNTRPAEITSPPRSPKLTSKQKLREYKSLNKKFVKEDISMRKKYWRMREQRDEDRATVISLESEVERLTKYGEDAYTAFQHLLEVDEAMAERLEGMESENQELRTENNALKTRCDNLEKDNRALKTRCDNLEKDNRALKTRCDNLERYNKALKTRCINLEKDNSALNTRCENLETSNKHLFTELDKLKRDFEQLIGTLTASSAKPQSTGQ